MAKKGGLGTGVDTLLRGSARQRRKHEDKSVDQAETVADNNSSKASRTATVATTKKQVSDVQITHNVENSSTQSTRSSQDSVLANGDRLVQVPLTEIRAGSYQPRRSFEKQALQELADSLKQQGLIQPILVRPYAGRFEIIAGERRWRAAELAGLSEIPAIVRDLDDKSVASVALIENIQRKDLNPLEEANALQRLRDEFGMTQEAVAESVGRSRAAVANILRLLDLQEDVKLMLESGEIDMGHARAILALTKEKQLAVAGKVVDQSLSVRATEALVREMGGRGERPGKKKDTKNLSSERDPNIVSLERQLGDTLGAKVQIHQQNKGKGRLEISYNSLDELDGILKHIK